jgi:hypothetical protein
MHVSYHARTLDAFDPTQCGLTYAIHVTAVVANLCELCRLNLSLQWEKQHEVCVHLHFVSCSPGAVKTFLKPFQQTRQLHEQLQMHNMCPTLADVRKQL